MLKRLDGIQMAVRERAAAEETPRDLLGAAKVDEDASERLETRGARWTGGGESRDREGLFIHPTALHGMLPGMSRTDLAWNWSGRPVIASRSKEA